MVQRLTSALLGALDGIEHGFFTREGGVSEGVYASLNVGRGSGDAPARVEENRRRAAQAFKLPAEALSNGYQIHSAEVVAVDAPIAGAVRADGVVTRSPAVLCGALAADCAPVLIADPKARVVAAVHAGWRGALAGVVRRAVQAMAELGAVPERMAAAVGPCIGPSSYEVGLEFMQTFLKVNAANARCFAPGAAPDKRLFDLPAFVLGELAAAGVGTAEWTGHDTYVSEALFFSNRRALHRGEADYGRLLSAIRLTP
jgi:YfiH family protein